MIAVVDASEVKRIVEANMRPMSEALGVHHWFFNIDYHSTGNENWKASCSRNIDYHHAHIIIDPAHCHSEKDVLESLRHEMLHVILAPFDLYRDLVTQHIQEDSVEARQERRAFNYAVEQMVLRLEKMFDFMEPGEFKLLCKLKALKPK
jgi:hypothetical protein